MFKIAGILLAILIVTVVIIVITGKMVSECARCMKDWEG